MTTRRDALKKLGGLAGLVGLSKFLPACKDDEEGGVVGITTYVYLMMENRSYNHYLGGRALEGLGGDGVVATMSNLDANGTPVSVFPATSAQLCDPDPPHGWAAAHQQFANMNGGFVTEYQARNPGGTEVMKYMTREQLPITWALADAYTTCDRWFCSVMGPTWPNRMYWHSGTSNGIMVNEIPNNMLTWPTMVQPLGEAGVDWAHYFGNISVCSALPDTVDTEGRVREFKHFIRDAKNGTLPQVSYIEPGYYLNDDHPPIHPANGQELIASIYKALAESPQWKNCLFVITYDENGGYFDHVAPPTTQDDFASAGFDQLGFRVPAMVMGPYAKTAYVSHTQYDHTSALKQLQNTFGLEPLTMRQAAANDLTDCIDMERLAAGEWNDPIELPAFDLTEWDQSSAECTDTDLRLIPQPKRGDCAMHDYANANPARAAKYDRRGHEVEYLNEIREFLRTPKA